MCTCEDTLVHILGAPYIDDVMSHDELTTQLMLNLMTLFRGSIQTYPLWSELKVIICHVILGIDILVLFFVRPDAERLPGNLQTFPVFVVTVFGFARFCQSCGRHFKEIDVSLGCRKISQD